MDKLDEMTYFFLGIILLFIFLIFCIYVYKSKSISNYTIHNEKYIKSL